MGTWPISGTGGPCGYCGETVQPWQEYCSRQHKEAARKARRRPSQCRICKAPATTMKRGRGGGPRCDTHKATTSR